MIVTLYKINSIRINKLCCIIMHEIKIFIDTQYIVV